MKQIVIILAICCITPTINADVGFSAVNKNNQAETSGNIYVVSHTKNPDGAFAITITIRPLPKWRVTRADLRFSASGKTFSTAPLRLFPQPDGTTRIECLLAADISEWTQVDVLLDSSDPKLPQVGHVHRIELNSYLRP